MRCDLSANSHGLPLPSASPVGKRADASYISPQSKLPLSAKLQNIAGRESEKRRPMNGPRGQDKIPGYGGLVTPVESGHSDPRQALTGCNRDVLSFYRWLE